MHISTDRRRVLDSVRPPRTASAIRPNALIRRIGVIGNHLPRQCGIATFTTDLSGALAEASPDRLLRGGDERSGPAARLSGRVRFEIAEADAASYRRAADFLNVNGVDVVSVQHEFGIFGGKVRRPAAAAPARAADADRHDPAHDPRPAEPAAAPRDGRDRRASERLVVMSSLGASTAGRRPRRRAGPHRRHPARHPGRCRPGARARTASASRDGWSS